jgi:hypothetical protein
MMTDQHICRTHGWVSSLTPCQDCLEEPEPRTCMFFGCDNPLPDLPNGYGAGQWPVGWCEECNDRKRNMGREAA